MFGFGLSNAMAKVPVKKIGAGKTIFLRGLFVSVSLFFVLIIFFSSTHFSILYILITFFLSIMAYIAFNFFYRAIKIGKVGIITPIANSSVIFTILFSTIFFKEVITLAQLSSIIVIIIGVFLISLNFKDLKNSQLFQKTSGIQFALITCCIWGVIFFLYKIPTNILGPILTSFIIELGILISSGIHLKIRKNHVYPLDTGMLTRVFFIGLFGAVGTLFYTSGIRISDVSIIAALSFANPLVSTVYGKIVYKEKLSILQYIAFMLILTGILLISYFSPS